MTDGPVNLNKARKQKARAERKRQADANAVRFGRTGAEKARDAERGARDAAHLDGHRLSRDEE
jgi:hypothetical protein